jgi:hypothetical protein
MVVTKTIRYILRQKAIFRWSSFFSHLSIFILIYQVDIAFEAGESIDGR